MNGVSSLNEAAVEDAALAYLEDLGWGVAHGPDIAPETPGAERTDYGDVVLGQRLRDALVRLNPDLPAGALDDAFRKLTRLEGTSLESRNRAFHSLVVDGVNVEYRDTGRVVRGAQVKVIDFDDPANNDWLAVNQFTVTENKNTRRPDVVLFVNGLPLSIIELKNPVDEDATIWTAWQQLQTYKAELPTLFAMNAALMVSDGMEARVGTLTAGREWFKPWRTISGEDLWAQLEAIVGTEKRLGLLAGDMVAHFEERLEVMDGKAMVVCMSRRICIGLYRELVRLRPEWHDEDDGKGKIKVVMTGSASDPGDWQPHIRNKPRREALAQRFRDASDSLNIVLVRDMWLTGFDAPSLHTMYIDKPMRGHGLMQAIARVNRVFKDKPGGLVVDYLGLAHELKYALATYTESGGTGKTALDQEEAVVVLREKYEICCGLFYGFDWSKWTTGTPQEKLGLLPAAQEHILAQRDGKDRCMQMVRELSQAFALAVPHE